MAPTPTPPPSADAAVPTSATNEDRVIKRNVACVNCRNSKVRCKASQVLGQPCQRCAKLSIPCVVDKSHRRITRRSKLEELEKELQNIKDAVINPEPKTSQWTPISPHTASTITTDTYPAPVALDAVPRPPSPSVGASTTATLDNDRDRSMKTGPATTRTLGEYTVSGEDVDWYFEKFLTFYHPFVPLLRKKDPDECFEANETLFWTVIYVACRRYGKDGTLFNKLVEHVNQQIWASVPAASLSVEAIHAIMFLCAWPLPINRFLNDPSATLISVAMNACMALGMHMGSGSQSQFLVGARTNIRLTEEESLSTWALCCILSQRAASSVGQPPPAIQLSDAHCQRGLDSPLWSDTLLILAVQRYLSKVHTSMHVHITERNGVPYRTVQQWEAEFDNLQSFILRQDTDLSYFTILIARLEIQTYYFCPSNPCSDSELHMCISAAFATSRALIQHALDLEKRSKFLSHAPHWAFRGVLDACCMMLSIMHSTLAPDMDAHAADSLAQQAASAITSCSIRDGDLPYRAAVILEAYWSARRVLPKIDGAPKAWSSRLGAAVTFWCLRHFKLGVQDAQNNSNGNRNIEPVAPYQSTGLVDAVPQQNETANPPLELFQDIDWSMFIDDFEWGDDGALVLAPY